MSWPLSQDYNEAIQNPGSSLADPNLRTGEPVLNAMGLPIPRSGNFADVYQFRGADGKTWALKCFTRKVGDLGARYAAIDKHLREANLPFGVGFRFHEKGIRIRKVWYPLLQMEWVEGYTLNDFVRAHADRPADLEALFLIWVRLAKRLRQGDLAHGDLQHGNVLLVPGAKSTTLGLKLIDYDGMWVPELARRPSGEAGHPAYQHPARRQGAYSFDVDRFPHLLIASALRALIVGGQTLWNQFDNGDNLLFREDDIQRPGESKLIQTLWGMGDPILRPLVGNLVIASQCPMSDSPWLDHLMASEEVLSLTAAQQAEVSRILGNAGTSTAVSRTVAAGSTNAGTAAADVFAALSAGSDTPADARPAFRSAISLYWLIPIGALLFGLMLLVVPISLLLMTRDREEPATSQEPSTIAAPPTTPAAPTTTPATKSQPPTTPLAPSPAPPPMSAMVDPTMLPPAAAPPATLQVLTPVWTVPGRAARRCLDYTRDGLHIVASPGESSTLLAYDAISGKADDPITGSVGRIRALVATNRSEVIMSGEDNVTALWDIAFRQHKRNIQVPEGETTPLAVTSNGTDVIVATDAGQLEQFGLDTGMPNRSWSLKEKTRIRDIHVSPDGSHWVAVDDQSRVTVGQMENDERLTIQDTQTTARSARLSKGGTRMLTFGQGPKLRTWNITKEESLHTLPGHQGGVLDAVVTADGKWVLSVGADRHLRIWGVDAGREVQSHALPEIAACVRLSPDGRFAVTASGDGPKAAIQLWRIGNVDAPPR